MTMMFVFVPFLLLRKTLWPRQLIKEGETYSLRELEFITAEQSNS